MRSGNHSESFAGNGQLSSTHPTAHLFVDESGVAQQSPVLALGALRFSNGHGRLVTELEQFRQRAQWSTELHFSELKRFNAHLYREVVRIVAASDARFTCLVVDRRTGDPFFRSSVEPWRAHAQATIALLAKAVAGREIVSVTVDHLSLPAGVNYEGYIRAAVNQRKDRLAVATLSRMDSKACWGLQLADVITGAVAHQYRQQFDGVVKAGSVKGQLAAFVAEQFNVESLVSANTKWLRVVTFERTRSRRRLSAVSKERRAS